MSKISSKQIDFNSDVRITGSLYVSGSVVDFSDVDTFVGIQASLPGGLVSSSAQFTNLSDPFTGSFSGSFSGDGSGLTGVTAVGTVSSSAQIDHDQTTNYDANEHFLQSAITTVGTVTSGNVDAILPSGTVSGSAQIVGNLVGQDVVVQSITGSFTGSFVGDGSGLTGVTAPGTVSQSAQIDHDQTTNYDANEHFLQSAITTVGTVTVGDVSAILPSGTVSGSAQFTTGSFTGSFTGEVSPTWFTQSSDGFVINAGTTNPATLTVASGNIELIASSGSYDYILPQENTTLVGTTTVQTLTNKTVSGSFSGSFQGDGSNLSGVTAASVDYVNVTNKPTLVSGSSQVSYTGLSNIPGGIVSSSAQFTANDDVTFGKVTATEFHTSFVSSSILYQSGSTKFGDTQDDVHTFTGSVDVSGSLSVGGTAVSLDGHTHAFFELTSVPTLVSGSSQIDHNQTTNYSASRHFLQSEIIEVGTVVAGDVSAILPIGTVSGSSQVSYAGLSNIPSGIVSSSAQFVNINDAFTGSFTGSFSGSFQGDGSGLTGITNLGTVTSGDVSQILPSGVVSGSSQVDYTLLQNVPSGIVSSSAQIDYTGITNVPSGIVSASSQFININDPFTGSFTGSFAGDVDATWFTQSADGFTINAGTGQLIVASGSIELIASGGFDYTFPSEDATLVGADTVQTLTNKTISGSFSGSFAGDGSNLSGVTAASVAYSNITSLPTLVSGSSQIDYGGITNVPSGIVSSSAQFTDLNAPFTGSFTGSFSGDGSGITGLSSAAIANYWSASNGRVITSVNADTVEGEANLTFDGSTLTVVGAVSASGVISASAFSGDGSGLTGLSSAAIANYWSASNGRIITSVNGDTVEGEQNLTFDGSTLTVNGEVSASGVISASAFSGDGSGLSGITTTLPAGTVSGSIQIDHDQTTNYDAAEHFTQASITTVGTVTAGDVSAILPSGTISGSVQVDYTAISNVPAGIVSGSSQVDYTGLTNIPSGIVSSSAQFNSLSSPFTGSFTGSFSGDGTNLSGVTAASVTYANVTGKPTLVSGSSQISYTGITNVPSGIVSGAAQIPPLLPAGTVSGSVQVLINSTSGSLNVNKGGTGRTTLTSGFVLLGNGTSQVTLKSGFVTGSSQIDHNATTNYSASRHFLQSEITTVGTVTVGNVNAILPSGTVSGSSQVSYTGLSNIPSGIVSGSSQVSYTGLSNVPSGIVSSSAQFTSLAAPFTGSFTGSFVGDGSNLTGLPSAAINSYTNTGANRLITSVDASSVQGEANLTFDGSQLSVIGTVSASSYSGDGSGLAGVVTSLPAGTVSGSAQIDHDQTTNFDANEHFLQSAITTVGTVTTGDVSAILPAGTVSGSVQVDYTAISNVPSGIVSGSSQVSYTGITNVPSGIVSSSAQIDHDQTTNYDAAEHFTQASITAVGTVTSGDVSAILPSGTVSGSSQVDYTGLSNIPSGIVSASAQIDHDQTTNYDANEHFTQAAITTVGTVTSGDVSAILPSGVVSGSVQVDYTAISNVPAGIVSGSSQVSYTGLSNIPSGIVSSSAQFTNLSDSFTGSFSGSFTGDGSGLTSVPDPTWFSETPDGFVITAGTSNTATLTVASGAIELIAEPGAFDYTLPGANTTLVGTDTTQTLTNKTVSGSFSGSFQGDGSNLSGVTAAAVAFANVTGKPTLVSGSAQIDHDQTANYDAAEHFTQASITTVGTVTSGDVSAILPGGTVSGSAQVSYTGLSNIPSGIVSSSAQFNSLSSPFTGSFTGSFAGDGTNLTGVSATAATPGADRIVISDAGGSISGAPGLRWDGSKLLSAGGLQFTGSTSTTTHSLHGHLELQAAGTPPVPANIPAALYVNGASLSSATPLLVYGGDGLVRIVPTTNAAGFQVFNTDFVSDQTNYEFSEIRYLANNFDIKSGKGGSGTTRNIRFVIDNTAQMTITTSSRIEIGSGVTIDAGIVSGSTFSGSFVGDGSGLTGIPGGTPSWYTASAHGFEINGGTTTNSSLTVVSGNIELNADGGFDYTFPSANTTLVGTDTTQTLTNKTVSGSFSGSYQGNFTGSFTGEVYPTWFTASGDGFTITAGSPNPASLTIASGNIEFIAGGGYDYTFPNENTTIVGTTTVQTLTNKTISGSFSGSFQGNGSGLTNLPGPSTASFALPVTASTGPIAVANGTVGFAVPPSLNTWNISGVLGAVYQTGSGAGQTGIQIRRRRGGSEVNVLSTTASIDAGEYNSSTAATAYVVNTSNDDLATGDMIYVDVTEVNATPATGLTVTITAYQ